VDDVLAYATGRTHLSAMDLTATALLSGVLLAAATFCGWRGARPWDPAKGPRMTPWRLLMVLCAAVGLLLLVHLLNLTGFETGAGRS
jgi:hypothetical protein